MSDPPGIGEVRSDLDALSRFDVVLYGSVLTDRFTDRSDVDVAVVTREPDRDRNRSAWRSALGAAPDRYDVRVFELLPLPVQHDIAEHHRVVFGDAVDLSYYFYNRTRRAWKDVEPRIRANRFDSVRERMVRLGLREGRS